MAGVSIPDPQTPLFAALIFFFIFLIGAIGEEIGWMGYVIEPLQNRWGAFKAGIIIGTIWAIWHIIPYLQAHQTPRWIVWQCISTVALRIIIIWFYNNTGKSVFVAVLFHAMINISMFLFPNYGSHYDPFVGAMFLGLTVVIIVFLWGRKNVSQNCKRPLHDH
ncbi:MAG: CPBP family intramembrane glutamic endopeptidase [Chitinophagaceae bacterium]